MEEGFIMSRGNVISNGYGAYELKAYYQRNMLAGTLFAAALMAIVIIGAYLYQTITQVEVTGEDDADPIVIFIELIPPPPISKERPRINIAQPEPIAQNLGNIPIPVADEEAPDMEASIYSQKEMKEIIDRRRLIIDGPPDNTGIKVIIPNEEYIPEPEEFVPAEIPAEMMHEVAPEYPHLARQAGLEAVVWVKVLVDKNGEVKKAIIYKSSGSRAGFDEAALAAAYKCKFRPAIQNGHPVAVWVAFEIEFSLTE
jgi:protein TonB